MVQISNRVMAACLSAPSATRPRGATVNAFTFASARVPVRAAPPRVLSGGRARSLAGAMSAQRAGDAPIASAPGPRSGVYVTPSGEVSVDGTSLRSIADQVQETPFYVYSQRAIADAYDAYERALEGVPSFVGYAVKANNNLHILRYLASRGCGAVLVSGNELRLAMEAGFEMRRTVFNGNGKQPGDLELAARQGCLINVDSEFDLANIREAARRSGCRARVLIRINPDIDPEVHPYVSTGLAASKFGIRNSHLDWFLHEISAAPDALELVGVHCHLGSTITKARIFADAAGVMAGFVRRIREAGHAGLSFLNIGGGLGIDYARGSADAPEGLAGTQKLPSPRELVDTVRRTVAELGLTLVMEPGRSLVGASGALVCRVLGTKQNGEKRFVVVDGSMAELIRPALYDAHQHIALADAGKRGEGEAGGEDKEAKGAAYDVVGPICESADFLGKNRHFPRQPQPGDVLAVLDAGAYCMAMASTYNMKLRPAEYWVTLRGTLERIRRAETMQDVLRMYD
ncbi:pyridoxal binding domain of pyridoxal-dependent decarboxylase [Helicosporidium sp. ATCC 50920]|nr:pyridoxal binding domain of pyridoxal-dependent decarboxylase [Helicosporidium sp. ATCC 50920]|eukprot:KDD76370.1 pyridoxal binding domain of pyridoxal-dependent decarboxylase [Helicosporidium sp. ATCC 50920]